MNYLSYTAESGNNAAFILKIAQQHMTLEQPYLTLTPWREILQVDNTSLFDSFDQYQSRIHILALPKVQLTVVTPGPSSI